MGLLLLQFAMITVRRFEEGGFVFSTTVVWQIVAPGVIAFLLAPVVHAAVVWMGWGSRWLLSRRRRKEVEA